jgi:hypothetical protein
VSRLIAARDRTRLSVRKVVFVGTPNAGTALADAKHMGDFIDTYTNLLSFLPDNGVTEALEMVIAVVKQFAVAGVKALPGLQSMHTDGELATSRLDAGETAFYALSSDYTPEPGTGLAALRALLQNRLLDKVFDAGNDLVVPTASVYGANGADFFPVAHRVSFGAGDAVAHTGFFGNPAAQRQIEKWLAT